MNTSKTVLSNLIWRFLERTGAQAVAFVVTVVLARIVEPEAYGTLALISVFTQIFSVFTDSGLATALIQKKDVDDLDYSTVFYANITLAIIAYAVLFVVAPAIGWFYNDSQMVLYVRVAGISLLLGGIKNVQQAYVSRNLIFKKFFYSTLGGTLVAAIVGISMAYAGFGVWALIVQGIVNLLIDMLILFITIEWRPVLKFSLTRFKILYNFGWKMLVSAIIDTVYNDLRQLIIGKLYTAKDLAFYNKGRQIPNLIVTNINLSIDSVLLPVMSSSQNDVSQVKELTRRSIKLCVYCLAPMMIGLSAVAETLVRLILTEKWLFCVPYMRIFCITYMFYPIQTANLNAIKALGRSDLFLKLEIIKKIVGMLVLFLTMRKGVMAIAASLLFTCFTSQIINSWPNKKLLGYSYLSQIKDILPSIMLALVMGACVYTIQSLEIPDVLILIFQILSGGGIYIIGSQILKIDSYKYLLKMIRSYVE